MINTTAIITILQASPLVDSVERVGDALRVTESAAVQGAGCDDRMYALMTRVVRNNGGLSRNVASCASGYTDDGRGIWLIVVAS